MPEETCKRRPCRLATKAQAPTRVRRKFSVAHPVHADAPQHKRHREQRRRERPADRHKDRFRIIRNRSSHGPDPSSVVHPNPRIRGG